MASSKLSCGPCGYDHISQDAHKWCTNCQEGFCKDCEKLHKATKMSRDHTLIGVEDYLKLSRISVIQTCDEHGKAYDSYCKTHDRALCLSCVLSQHKSCGDIIPLEEAAKYAKTSTALTDLEETISIGLKNVQSIIQNTTSAHLDQQEKNIKEEIRGVRIKINNRLDKMEQNLILELESKLAKYRSKHGAVLKHIKELEKTIKGLKEQTTEMKKIASDLQIFLGTRQINREVNECLKSTLKYNVTDKCNVKVEIDPVLNSLLTEVKKFGNINTVVTIINIPLSQPKIGQAQIHLHPVAKSVSEVGVKLKQTITIKKESTVMWVTGCTILTDGQLLIADYKGKKQLMQYNQNGRHVRDIPVSSTPFGVKVIDSERVAVSYGQSNYIEILNIQNTTVEKKVALNNETRGLSYQGGKLYVVVKSRGIVIIELSGKIVNILNINVHNLRFAAATTDRIYYSDVYTDTVTCCDMTGKQIWKFQDDYVRYPRGLTVDNNQNVFVVAGDVTVTIISRDGQTSKILLTKSDGMNSPSAIHYSKDTGDLLVCNYNDTKAFLFKVT